MTFSLTTTDALARIREQGEQLGVYVNTRLDEAEQDARRLSKEPARSPLHGLPYGLKDEWETTMRGVIQRTFSYLFPSSQRRTNGAATFGAKAPT